MANKRAQNSQMPMVALKNGTKIKSWDQELLVHVAAALENPSLVQIPTYPATFNGNAEKLSWGTLTFYVESLKRVLTLSAPEPVLLRFAAMIGRATAAPADTFKWSDVIHVFPDLKDGKDKPVRSCHLSLNGWEGAVHGNAPTLFNLMVGYLDGTLQPNIRGKVGVSESKNGTELRDMELATALAYFAAAGQLKFEPVRFEQKLVTGLKVAGISGLTSRLNGTLKRIELVKTEDVENPAAKALIWLNLDRPVRIENRALAEALMADYDLPEEVRMLVLGSGGTTEQTVSVVENVDDPEESVQQDAVVEEVSPVAKPAKRIPKETPSRSSKKK